MPASVIFGEKQFINNPVIAYSDAIGYFLFFLFFLIFTTVYAQNKENDITGKRYIS